MLVLQFILQLVLVLFAVKIAGDVSVRLGQPSVLGKILVGILIGPAVLGWVQETDVFSVFSQIGVLLLMFLAGLETDLKDLNANKKAALLVAVGGVIAPIAMTYGIAQFFDFTTVEAIFLGLLLAATSVSISVQTLRELGWLNTKEGSALLGAAVLDDVIVVILIAVAMSFFGTGAAANTNIGLVIGKQVAFFVVLFFVARWLVPLLIKWFAKFKVTQVVLSAGLIIAFGLAYLPNRLESQVLSDHFSQGSPSVKRSLKKKLRRRSIRLQMEFSFRSFSSVSDWRLPSMESAVRSDSSSFSR